MEEQHDQSSSKETPELGFNNYFKEIKKKKYLATDAAVGAVEGSYGTRPNGTDRTVVLSKAHATRRAGVAETLEVKDQSGR